MQNYSILLESASLECSKGDYKQGIHLYSKYIQQVQNDAKAYYQRGKAYFKVKDYAAAASDLTKAIAIHPEEAHFYGERGLIYFMAGKEDRAMDNFDKAIELEPNNGFRYASRAFINDRLGQLEKAVKDYQKAIEIDPEDAISYNNLGLVMDKMGYKKKASNHYDKAAKLDPKNFGMSSTQQVQADSKTETPPTPKPERTNDKPESPQKEPLDFKGTLKSLITSKKERKEFWNFVVDKIQNKKSES